MPKNSASREERRHDDEDHLLATLKALWSQNGRGATRTESSICLLDERLDVAAGLGMLLAKKLVICEGTAGYPLSGCWKPTDEG